MPPLGFLVGGLLGGLAQVAGSIAGRVLLALGFGFVTYSGLSVATDFLIAQIKADMNSLPVEVGSFLAYVWVDKAMTMIFSAHAAALAIKMAGGTSITKMVVKK